MLEDLFGNKYIARIFFYLLKNKQCYALELSKIFESPVYGIQQALARLERTQIIVSTQVGRTRLYQFNPNYPLLETLLPFITQAYDFLPERMKQQYYERIVRKRPRRKGKPL